MADQGYDAAPVSIEERLDPFLLMRRAITVLSDRALLWIVVVMSFGLFAHAAKHPGPWTFAGAATFTVLATALMWRERKR